MVAPIPAGHEGMIPHLVVDGAAAAIEFYQKAFGAQELHRMPAPDGRLMHAEIMIGKNPVYLADDFPEFCGGVSRAPKSLGGSPVTIHQYVEDCDASVARAAEAGGEVTMPATDMFWGDRYGTIKDPFGHSWSFATHVKDLSPDEMQAAAQQAFS